MTVRLGRRVFAIAALGVCALSSRALTAHQLDEYLQATRIGVDRERIVLEIDLTPGVAVGPQVIASIDTDGDGRISTSETAAYATAVLASVSLVVDGRRPAVALASIRVPDLDSMRRGVGTIQVQALAAVPSASTGRHVLLYRNMHRPDMGVYLANALVPADPAIEITGQQRDVQQHELRLDYAIAGNSPVGWSWRLSVPAALASLLTAAVWRRRKVPA